MSCTPTCLVKNWPTLQFDVVEETGPSQHHPFGFWAGPGEAPVEPQD